jgi:hypothetical protein
MLTRTLRHLHPEQASRSPALFMTLIAAALLSVLALRDTILAAPTVSLETLAAAGLWGVLLLSAGCLAIRGR